MWKEENAGIVADLLQDSDVRIMQQWNQETIIRKGTHKCTKRCRIWGKRQFREHKNKEPYFERNILVPLIWAHKQRFPTEIFQWKGWIRNSSCKAKSSSRRRKGWPWGNAGDVWKEQKSS